MYFDPLSSWLVVLIADGISIAEEKLGGGTISEFHQNNIKQRNNMLNGDIRRIKEKYGLTLAEMAYEQIQLQIKITKDSLSFRQANGQIVLDLDNQEYIISVLEECAKRYSKYKNVEEYRKKAEWFNNAAIEARRKKEQFSRELKDTQIRKEKEKIKQQSMSNIFLVLGLIILFIFILFFFS